MKLSFFKDHPEFGYILAIITPLIIGLFLTLTKGYFFIASSACAILAIGGALFSIVHFFKKIENLREKILFSGILLFTIALSFSSEPTIFTGRDQGSISMAAIELSKNNALAFSAPIIQDFFSIYGPGEALNFPGFHYDTEGNLITKFPLGYTVLLAGFFSLFGTIGFTIANTLLLFGSFLLIFSVIRSLKKEAAFSGLILAGGSFFPIWFSKFTLTENLALFLFLSLTYAIISVYQYRSIAAYWIALASALIFPFVRIEGFIFLIITLVLLGVHPFIRSFIAENITHRIILPILAFLSFLVFDLISHTPFYRVMGKELFSLFQNERGVSGTFPTFLEKSTDLLTLFATYGLLPIFVAGTIGALLCIKQRNWIMLIPIAVALPTFFYFLSPSITPDHPWMLRRFLFSVWPALLILTSISITILFSRNTSDRYIRIGIFTLLLIAQLPALSKTALLTEHANLFQETTELSKKFDAHDRILIDKRTTGDGFTMIAGPFLSLLDQNAAYFFNPNDLTKLPWRTGEKTYLITPTQTENEWQNISPQFTLTPRDTFKLSDTRIESRSLTNHLLPQQTQTSTEITIYEITPTR